MRKVGLCLVLALSLIGFLYSIAQPLEIVRGVESKSDKFNVHVFTLQQNFVYAADTKSNQIRKWDITRKTWLPGIIRLSKQSKISDLCVDENTVYVLESANSRISIYDQNGKLLRTINTKGSPAAQFKNATRILVNYQGYIYVLDKGRGELLSFTNEGMLLGKVAIKNPISMSLGEDQILRVLQGADAYYRIANFGVYLDLIQTDLVRDHSFPKDDLIDICLSPYNEYYALFGKKANIKKLDKEGVAIPRSQFGFKGNRLSLGNFHTPSQIRCFPHKGAMVLGILDSFHKAIQLFTDTEFENKNMLRKPLYSMKPVLSELKDPVFMDYIPTDSLRYYINMSLPGKGGFKKPVPQISAQDANGVEVFSTLLPTLKKSGVKSFDAMDLYQGKLYVCDSKAHAIHLFDAITGVYISSFGEPGKGEGKLNAPVSIAISRDGFVYVSDSENMRITMWSAQGMYMQAIDLKSRKLKPGLLRMGDDSLYFVANQNRILKINLQNPENIGNVIQLTKISTFELLYENRLGIVDATTQNLVILFDNQRERSYLALHPKAEFPFFSDIYSIRYDHKTNELKLCDRKQPTQRNLRFYYSPLQAKWQKLQITEDRQVELSWDPGIGISNWIVYEFTDPDTLFHRVTEPRLLVFKPQKNISTYRIASLSDDNRVGPLSQQIEDAYSHARYHLANNSYALAVQALRRAQSTIDDPKITGDIANAYKEEAQSFTKVQEYERALSSLILARHAVGDRQDLILDTINIYKYMRAYSEGIRFIRQHNFEKDPLIHKQLIALYNLYRSYDIMITEALSYLATYPGDVGIMKYLVAGFEIQENFSSALNTQRSILAVEDSFENRLKNAELMILAGQADEAINQINMMLTRFTKESQDEIYYYYGEALSAKKQYSLACEKYESAIRINPNNGLYHYKLANALMETRRLMDAQKAYDNAWKQNPKSVEFGFAYGKALEKSNKVLEALNILDAVHSEVAADSSSVDFHTLYGDLLLRNNRYDDAYRELGLALSFFPENTVIAAKYAQVVEAREAHYRDRPPLVIVDFKYDPIYPSLQEYYKTNPIGMVSIFNTRNIPVQNIKVSIQIPQITEKAFEATIPSILANETKLVDIVAAITPEVFELSKQGEFDISTYLNIHYVFDKQDRFLPSTNTLRVLRLQAMNWDNRRQYACFINPADANVRNFVNSKILATYDLETGSNLPRNLLRAMQIFTYYGVNGVSYLPDPSSSNSGAAVNDYVQFPFQTIAAKMGDCDDLVCLLAASLSSIGVDCGFLDVQGHVILVADLGIGMDAIINAGFDLSHFIFRNGKYWVPIEATVLGKQPFGKSWMAALKRYNEILESSILPDLIEFNSAHSQYPPVQYTESVYDNEYSHVAQVKAAFQSELDGILLINQISKEEEFIATINKYPKNLNVLNQYALWCVEIGKFDTAENLWLRLLKEDPNNFTALVNIGNLYHKQSRFDQSRINYLKVLGHNKDTDNIYRNLCIMEYRAGNLSKARDYFNRMPDKNVLKKLDPGIYANLVGVGE